MFLRLLFLTTCLYISTPSFSQEGTWKKISKSANQLYANGNYEEAANYYMEAYKQKKSKTEFLYKAATCYDKLRFYSKSANLYKELIGNGDYPLASLQFARSLKQNGEYEEAIPAFKGFLTNYKGADINNYIKIVKKEVEGCDLALTNPQPNKELIIEHLSDNINTMADEVAPLPFNDDILYYSSTMEGFSKIYRSHFQNGDWTKAVIPNFPKFKDQHVAHGTFTPDNQRFYFTLCNNTDFNVVDSQCDIYVTVRADDAWSNPRKLRDYVKLEGTTATHPYVMHEGDMEVLYFSSDRKGGIGGMDIWFMTRHIDSPEYDFTLPKNAGNNINTTGDEITPFYNNNEGILYFSSNGHIALGGFDVFKSLGSMSKFSKAQNLGKPINSSADDYYFIENKSQTGGFISSNRTYGSDKLTTDNDDLFFFSTPVKEIFARGNVYDKSNSTIISDVQVILYEVRSSGKKRLLQSIIANSGAYQFSLIPERAFEIEVIKDDFKSSTYSFNTFAFDENKEYGKSIYLEKEMMTANFNEPVFQESTSTASVDKTISSSISSTPHISNPIDTEPTPVKPRYSESEVSTTFTETNTNTDTYINSYYQGMEVTTSAPKINGTYYKVQISTAGYFDENDTMFDSVRSLGSFQTEEISEKGWTRILISEFYSLSKARDMMNVARISGFPEAFVVKYRNGNRKN